MKKIVLTSVMALSLSACLSNQDGGALVGAAAGGLLGNTVGKGSTRTAATIIGAAVGGIAGSKVGESMDKAENAEDVIRSR